MALNAILSDPEQNSYVTEEEADSYFEDRAFSSKWFDYEPTEKEPLLILCSHMLDWYITWKGFKTDSAQSMDWPRSSVILSDGSSLSDSVLPQEVKTATFEMVMSTLVKGKDRTLEDPLMGLEKLQVSVLSIKAKPDQSGSRTTSVKPIPDKVLSILKEFRSSSSFGVVRLMRG